MKISQKLVVGGLFTVILGGGFFAAYSLIKNAPSERKVPHYIRNPRFGSNVFGAARRRYFDQLTTVSQLEKSHIPFSDTENSLSSDDINFVIDKNDFVFEKDVKADEDGSITWSCWVTFTSFMDQGDIRKQETCRFFVYPPTKDAKKCDAYAEDLTFLPFHHITSKSQLPPNVLVSILNKNIFWFPKQVKKIVLAKNDKDYFSINENALKKDSCYLLDQNNLNYFLVKAIVEKQTDENLFLNKRKNYFCADSKLIFSIPDFDVNVLNRKSKCDVFELKNNIDANTSNLPQYISDLKTETISKDKLKNEKLYILKTTENISTYSPHNYFEDIWLHNQKGDKVHGKLTPIAKIEITYDDERPDFYYPIIQYSQKKFIVKANNNWINSTNTNNFQCFYKYDRKIWGFNSSKPLNECKIYKFEKDVFDIKDISFKKAAKPVTNPKTEIKNGAYYILDMQDNEDNRMFFNNWLERNLYTFVFGSDANNNKVDLYLDTRFFGDFKQDASEKNNFFLFTDEDKNTKNTVNNSTEFTGKRFSK